MIERIFNERYRLDDPVGRGGMATVYAGTDTLLRRRVAIKVLRAEFALDSGFVERFYAEAQHAARLAHPNIVNVYDVGRSGDEYFIVMEFVDGTTLSEMIENDGRLPEPVAVDYATQICNGLAYAHRQELLHRDIKPANILVTKDDVVKISDFGIARAVSKSALMLTAPGMVMGSVYYVSPEQAQGLELAPASDLYSLGVVIYQMLTGKLPYTGETPVTVALKHVSHPIPSLELEDATISPALGGIVRKLLQKDPELRFRSAAEVATALREAREHPLEVTHNADSVGAPAGVLRDDPETPPPRRIRRAQPAEDTRVLSVRGQPNRKLLGVLATLAVLAAVFAAFFIVRQSNERLAVANVQGIAIADARAQLERSDFIVHMTRQPSEIVPADRVIEQEPAPSTSVAPGSTVYLIVSSGMPNVELGDLRRFSRDDAERYIRDLKLIPKVTEKFDTAPRGTVLSQAPKPGAHVAMHSPISLTVSKGLKPVSVPDLVSLPIDRATALIRDQNLGIDVSERAASGSIAPNTVLSQDPKAGTSVEVGTRINVVVSSGQVSGAVPDVTSASIGDAARTLTGAGFTPAIVYVVQPSRQGGVVLDQTPRAGDKAERGARVSVTVAVPGVIPDVAGMTLDQSKRALLDAGYRIGNVAYTQKGTEGTSAYTEPAAGSILRPGEAVTIYYNSPGPQ